MSQGVRAERAREAPGLHTQRSSCIRNPQERLFDSRANATSRGGMPPIAARLDESVQMVTGEDVREESQSVREDLATAAALADVFLAVAIGARGRPVGRHGIGDLAPHEATPPIVPHAEGLEIELTGQARLEEPGARDVFETGVRQRRPLTALRLRRRRNGQRQEHQGEESLGGASGSGHGGCRVGGTRLAGLEPATLGLEGRCSIQLSYRRNE
jgi:hypothetical protein